MKKKLKNTSMDSLIQLDGIYFVKGKVIPPYISQEDQNNLNKYFSR